jgi:hypothetical protein
MASNELEVLDPAAKVEKLEDRTAGRVLNRRNLMAGLGIAGAAIGAGLMSRRSVRRPGVVQAASYANTFTQTDYLNFLLNIKYLQATLYSYLTQGADIPAQYTVTATSYIASPPVNGTALNATTGQYQFFPNFAAFPANNYPAATTGTASAPPAKTVFTTLPQFGSQITDMLNEIYYDELNQLINLQSLIGPLGTIAITRPALDLLGAGGTASATSTSVATTAAYTPKVALGVLRILEDVAVTAFAGVAEFLRGASLTAAAQIFAIDGQHAGALRLATILLNNGTAGTVPNLLADSDIDPDNGNFYPVQPDDVAPVDPLSAALAASGPIPSTTPILTSTTTQEVLASGCTAPFATAGAFTSCTPTQYQGFFDTTGSGTASSSTPPIPGFVFKRTPAQVLSILYGKLATATGIPSAAPSLPSTAIPPLSSVVSTGGFFPQGFGGQINVIT